MSVYGNMILENNNKSLIDISNEMTEICAEFTGYNNFLNEFVLESSLNVEITNEGVVETVKTVFGKIKDFIMSIIEKIREFISSLFSSNKKNKTKEKDQKAKEAIKQLDKCELVPVSDGNSNTGSNNTEIAIRKNANLSTDVKTIKNVKIGSVKRYVPVFKEIFKASDIFIKGIKQNSSKIKSSLASMPSSIKQFNFDTPYQDQKAAMDDLYNEISQSIANTAQGLTQLKYNPKEIEIIGENGTLADFKKLPSNIKQELLTGVTYYKETTRKYNDELEKVLKDLYDFIVDMEKKSKSLVADIDEARKNSTALQPYVKLPSIIGTEVANVNKILPVYTTLITKFENQRDRILNAIKISKLSFRN